MKLNILLIAMSAAYSIHADAQTSGGAGPHLLIYKTKKDYSKYVPVVLSDDKTRIVSYPDPADIKKKGKGMRPTKLHKKYLMDNYGVGANTAYLKITRAQYAAMKSAPSTDDLYKKIMVKNPLTTLYDCGLKSSYNYPVDDVNKLIDDRELTTKCKPMLAKK